MNRPVRVVLCELVAFDGVFPLAASYLSATAKTSAAVRAGCMIEVLAVPVQEAEQDIYARLFAMGADAYGFSCYVWNMGLVRRLAKRLMQSSHLPHILLGGPHAANQGNRELCATYERLVLCNGEGEATFSSYLTEVLLRGGPPDAVPNLSFYRDGALVTTSQPGSAYDLGDIPSPYTGCGQLGNFSFAVIETVRGCPYRCTYCTWGLATSRELLREFPLDRVKGDITAIAARGVDTLYIADANFGYRSQSTAIATYIAECHMKYGYPRQVMFSPDKAAGDRSVCISKILRDAGVQNSHSIPIQSLNPMALDIAQRSRVVDGSYLETLKRLRAAGVPHFAELIWPLPGETLQSFINGISRLSREGVDGLVVYPCLLLPNSKMKSQAYQLGLQTLRGSSAASDDEFVVASRWLSESEYRAGLRMACHICVIRSLQALRFLSHWLDEENILPLEDLLVQFDAFCLSRPMDGYTRICNQSVEPTAWAKDNVATVMEYVLYSGSRKFDSLLAAFVRTLESCRAPGALCLLEFDLVSRPRSSPSTPTKYGHEFTYLRVIPDSRRNSVVEVPNECLQVFEKATGLVEGSRNGSTRAMGLRRILPKDLLPSKRVGWCYSQLHALSTWHTRWLPL